MGNVRKVHREVTRQAAKVLTRLYFEKGLDRNAPADAPPRWLQRDVLRHDRTGDMNEAAWSAMTEYGLDRIEALERSELPSVCDQLVQMIERGMRESLAKPITAVEAGFTAESRA